MRRSLIVGIVFLLSLLVLTPVSAFGFNDLVNFFSPQKHENVVLNVDDGEVLNSEKYDLNSGVKKSESEKVEIQTEKRIKKSSQIKTQSEKIIKSSSGEDGKDEEKNLVYLKKKKNNIVRNSNGVDYGVFDVVLNSSLIEGNKAINVFLVNLGNTDEDFDIELFVDDVLVSSSSVNGDTRFFTFYVSISSGTHSLKIVVSSVNDVDSSNNEQVLNLEFESKIIDYKVSDIVVDNLVEGLRTVNVDIVNLGNTDEDFDVELFIDDVSVDSYIGVYRGTRYVQYDNVNINIGEHDFKVVVSSVNDVDSSNNERVESYEFESSVIDYKVSDIVVDNLVEGLRTVSVDIVNLGNTDEDFDVELFIDDVSISSYTNILGFSRSVQYNNVNVDIGEDKFKVVISSNNDVDSSNNELVKDFIFTEIPDVDYKVSDIRVDNLFKGLRTVSVDIVNEGDVDEDFDIELFVDSISVSSSSVSGGTRFFTFSDVSSSGTHSLKVVVNSVNDIDSSNNVLIKTFDFSCGFSGGSGIENNPYKLSTINDLKCLRDDVNSGNNYEDVYLKLINDISFSSSDYDDSVKGWEPIGVLIFTNNGFDVNHDYKYFSGHFDGDGFSVKNLFINSENRFGVGFFGGLSSGSTVSNLHLKNVNILGKSYVGGLVGHNNEGLVNNSSSSGSVTGDKYVGGLIGGNNGIVIDSFSLGNVYIQSKGFAGGLVGDNWGEIRGHSSSSNVNGNGILGGWIGINRESGFIKVDYDSIVGTVNGESGILIGSNDGSHEFVIKVTIILLPQEPPSLTGSDDVEEEVVVDLSYCEILPENIRNAEKQCSKNLSEDIVKRISPVSVVEENTGTNYGGYSRTRKYI